MGKVELLAPVGSYDAFISAINNGADAIYLAGEHFGAREKATFTNDEIKAMIKYAHVRDVRVHVVINTLIYDDEMDKVLSYTEKTKIRKSVDKNIERTCELYKIIYNKIIYIGGKKL